MEKEYGYWKHYIFEKELNNEKNKISLKVKVNDSNEIIDWEYSINGSEEMCFEKSIPYEKAFNTLLTILEFDKSKKFEALTIGGGDLQLHLHLMNFFNVNNCSFSNLIIDPLFSDLKDLISKFKDLSNVKDYSYIEDYYNNEFSDKYKIDFKSKDLVIVDVSDPLEETGYTSPNQIYTFEFLYNITKKLLPNSYLLMYEGFKKELRPFSIEDTKETYMCPPWMKLIAKIHCGYGYMSLWRKK